MLKCPRHATMRPSTLPLWERLANHGLLLARRFIYGLAYTNRPAAMDFLARYEMMFRQAAVLLRIVEK